MCGGHVAEGAEEADEDGRLHQERHHALQRVAVVLLPEPADALLVLLLCRLTVAPLQPHSHTLPTSGSAPRLERLSTPRRDLDTEHHDVGRLDTL